MTGSSGSMGVGFVSDPKRLEFGTVPALTSSEPGGFEIECWQLVPLLGRLDLNRCDLNW